MSKVIPGTPRWAVAAAYVAVLSVLPSAIWRTALGFGADLGTTQQWRDFQEIPGSGTWYVVGLSVLSIGAAALTLGLVYPWGERVPRWVPGLGGRSIPTLLVVCVATVGALLVIMICAMSAYRWDRINCHEGCPAPGWYELISAAYLPATLWGPAVLAATWAYWRRRTDGAAVEPVTGFEPATSSLQEKRSTN